MAGSQAALIGNRKYAEMQVKVRRSKDIADYLMCIGKLKGQGHEPGLDRRQQPAGTINDKCELTTVKT